MGRNKARIGLNVLFFLAKTHERSLVMNKRITSILLTLVMLLGVVLFAISAYAVSVPTFTLEADKAEAYPGDTITYKV